MKLVHYGVDKSSSLKYLIIFCFSNQAVSINKIYVNLTTSDSGFIMPRSIQATGGSRLSCTVVKLDSCLARIFCHFFSFFLYNLM